MFSSVPAMDEIDSCLEYFLLLINEKDASNFRGIQHRSPGIGHGDDNAEEAHQ